MKVVHHLLAVTTFCILSIVQNGTVDGILTVLIVTLNLD